MPEISSLKRGKPTAAVVDFDGETVNLMFDAERITPAWVNETQERVNAQDQMSLPKALAEVLLSWDVTDGGEPVEPSADLIGTFSFPVLGEFFTAIMESAVPGAAEGNASSPSASGPSQGSEGTLASFPNGSAGSTSPNVSESLSKT